jgi:UTP:GlnB (protein PII) uridylyltransferase
MRIGLGRPGRHSDRPEVPVLGDEHRGPVDRRRAAAVGLVEDGSGAATRIADAPPGYLLVHGSSDIARHCELLCPLPLPSEVRVEATPGRTRGEWHVDVATRDRRGLLAAFTGVLAAANVDVVQAVLATWDDGAALEAFVVRCDDAPDGLALQHAFVASLREPLEACPVGDAGVTFDDSTSALYTQCDVRAADRPGLLHALAVAMASAGADVHAARVRTAGGLAHDVFDLSDPTGRKLDTGLENRIRSCLREGRAVSR